LNVSEQLVAGSLMLIGGFLWAQVIGVLTSALSTMSPGTTDFKLTIAALNKYIYNNDLPEHMSQRLRDYFFRTRHLWDSNQSSKVLRKLSPRMQGEVLMEVNQAWLKSVHWLAEEDTAFLAELILDMSPAVFAPQELIEFSALFVVTTGVALCGGRIVNLNATFGEDMLLSSPALRARETVRSLTYLEVYYTDRDRVWLIASRHHNTYRRLRRATGFMALHRFVVLVAKAQRKLKLVQAIQEQYSVVEGKKPTAKWKKALTRHKTYSEFQTQMGIKGIREIGKMTREQRVVAARERELNELLFKVSHKTGSSYALGAPPTGGDINAPAPAPADAWQPREGPPRSAASSQCHQTNGTTNTTEAAADTSPALSQAKMVEDVQRPRRRRHLAVSMSAQQDDLVNAVASIHSMVKALDEKLDATAGKVERENAAIREAILQLKSAGVPTSSMQGRREAAESELHA
jgi:hypothetical protein